MSEPLKCNVTWRSHGNSMAACNHKYLFVPKLIGPTCLTIIAGKNGAMVACFGVGVGSMCGWCASCHDIE